MKAYNAVVQVGDKIYKMQVLSPDTVEEVEGSCYLRFGADEVQLTPIGEKEIEELRELVRPDNENPVL